MSRLCPLFSSSKGNSILVACGQTAVLVDVGISYKQLSIALDTQGYAPSDLEAVLITHEHTDHIKGLELLLKKTDAKLVASKGTIEYLYDNGYIPNHTRIIECGSKQALGDIEVEAFHTPHDAVESVGYRFMMPDLRTLAISTDLGHVTDTVRKHLLGADLVLLESNYDLGMLECSSYPYVLKRRIKGDFGHLSNEACAEMLVSLIKSGTTRLVLGHLSEQNNIPHLARQVAVNALTDAGFIENRDYQLMIAPPRDNTQAVIF